MSMDIIAPGGVELVLVLLPLLVSLFAATLLTIAFCKICFKAGFSGALGLLMLVPIANVILPLYLAFAEWPALKDTAQ